MIVEKISFNDHKNYFEITLSNNKTVFANYELYSKLNISKGKVLSESELLELDSFEKSNKLINVAINFINYRIRSEKEIRNRLYKEKASDDEIEKIILHLKNIKLIDDKYFAKVFFDNKSRINRWSSRKIFYELKLKGISSKIVNEVILDTYDIDYNNAYYLVNKKIKIWNSKFNNFELKNKIYNFLSQRGFSYEVISNVTEELV